MLHRFRHSIASFSLPTRLNNPFHYTPHPLCELAARELRAYLCERKEWTEELSAGKMFGVLVVKDPAGTVGFLAAFSGNLAGSNSHEYFVPPIYDMLRPGDFFRTEEASISDLNRQIETLETAGRYRELLRTIEETETEVAREIAAAKARMRIAKTAREARRREHPDENTQTALVRESQYEKAELHRLKQSWKNRLASLHAQRTSIVERIESLRCERKARSAALQAKLFRKFRLLNALGEIRDLAEIFATTPQRTPPAGAGECAAPKLLQYAFEHRLTPLAIAEFWWGASPKGEIRRHGHYYPACRGKCGPILAHMLRGLDVEPEPDQNLVGSDQQRPFHQHTVGRKHADQLFARSRADLFFQVERLITQTAGIEKSIDRKTAAIDPLFELRFGGILLHDIAHFDFDPALLQPFKGFLTSAATGIANKQGFHFHRISKYKYSENRGLNQICTNRRSKHAPRTLVNSAMQG